MKAFIILTCMVTVCLAFPNNKLYVRNVAETIRQTAEVMNNNKIMKRQSAKHSNAMHEAFDLTDGNHDGHITAEEFATFYVENMPNSNLTKSEWIRDFRIAVPKIDSNNNNTLEIDEYAVLARYGGYSD